MSKSEVESIGTKVEEIEGVVGYGGESDGRERELEAALAETMMGRLKPRKRKGAWSKQRDWASFVKN